MARCDGGLTRGLVAKSVASRAIAALLFNVSLASAQLPNAVRLETMEWSTPDGVTHAVMWSPMGKPGPFPTLVFSPGYGQKAAAYSVLLNSWASRGFVVLAIEHPPVPDPDRVELYDVSQRVARQLSDVLSHILREQLLVAGAFARIDPARVGVVGHSVGGSAAAQACGLDTRYRACMDLDGTIFGPVVHTGMTQPFFLLQKRVSVSDRDPPRWYENRDQGTLHEDSVWAHTRTMHWLTVDHLDHMSFVDASLDETRMQEAQRALGFRLGAKRAQEMTTHYALLFFGAYLNGARRGSAPAMPTYRGAVLRSKP